MKLDIGGLLAKANAYKEVLQNTIDYRKQWHSGLKKMILETLDEIKKQTGVKAIVECKDNINNLEAIVFDLGRSASGISENLENTDIKRTMVKSNGALIYQQLFNGKIMIMISSPYIEGYGEPKPPRMVEILRPDELKQPFILRHMESLLKDLIEWEDYDDDEPAKPPVGFNPIGFNNQILED
jgi:hypothetical protein